MAIKSRRRGNQEVAKHGRKRSLFIFHGIYLTIIIAMAVVLIFGQQIPLLKHPYAGTSAPIVPTEIKPLPDFSRGQLTTNCLVTATQLSYPEIKIYDQLLTLTPDQLAKVDIGLMNLLCAEGLPGAEKMDIDECLKKLDYWAQRIREDTELRMHSFHENPAKYYNSENIFKMTNLILAIQEEIAHYNMKNMTNPNFADSREVFIHGLLGGGNHGSCANLPVLCVAIGRRLGYPLKLVPTSEHYFPRWEDTAKGERFNMEISSKGTDVMPDEYYRNWPRKQTKIAEVEGYLLKSLSPEGELAVFLHLRGDIWTAANKPAEAQVAFAQAYRLMPGTMIHMLNLAATVDREIEKLAKRDFEAIGTGVKYTVCPTMDANDLANAWVYRYPKLETVVGPILQNGNVGKK